MPAVWGWAGMGRLNPLLILDLDETLLFSTEEDPGCGPVFRAGPYFTRLRPYLSDFIQTTSTAYDLAIWSSSSRDYAKAIYVTEWTGAPDDTELLRLGPYLLSIRDTPDFRRIEKRFWRA